MAVSNRMPKDSPLRSHNHEIFCAIVAEYDDPFTALRKAYKHVKMVHEKDNLDLLPTVNQLLEKPEIKKRIQTLRGRRRSRGNRSREDLSAMVLADAARARAEGALSITMRNMHLYAQLQGYLTEETKDIGGQIHIHLDASKNPEPKKLTQPSIDVEMVPLDIKNPELNDL